MLFIRSSDLPMGHSISIGTCFSRDADGAYDVLADSWRTVDQLLDAGSRSALEHSI